jgi:hypothetical protein
MSSDRRSDVNWGSVRISLRKRRAVLTALGDWRIAPRCNTHYPSLSLTLSVFLGCSMALRDPRNRPTRTACRVAWQGERATAPPRPIHSSHAWRFDGFTFLSFPVGRVDLSLELILPRGRWEVLGLDFGVGLECFVPTASTRAMALTSPGRIRARITNIDYPKCSHAKTWRFDRVRDCSDHFVQRHQPYPPRQIARPWQYVHQPVQRHNQIRPAVPRTQYVPGP